MSELSYSDIDNGRKFTITNNLGQIVGHAMATTLDKNTLELNSIQVIPPERRQGYASLLLEEVLNYAKHVGASMIVGDFTPEYKTESAREAATEFYKKHGIRVHNGRLTAKIAK